MLPNSSFIVDMDPVLKMYLYYQWLGDHRDNAELAKNHAYLLGSFTNPEAVQQLMNDNVHESSDDDLAESMRMVETIDVRSMGREEKPIKRKKRKSNIKT